LIPPRAKGLRSFWAGQKGEQGQGIGRLRVPCAFKAASKAARSVGKDSTRIFLRDCDRFLEPDCQRAFASESRGPTFSTRAREAIGAVRGAFAHYPMQVGNVGMTFKLPGFRFQG